MLEASTTKVSSKGQVVIPISVRKAAGFEEGETLLALAVGDTVVLKRITSRTFEETLKPVWERVRQLGLSEGDVDALVEEAKASRRP